MHYVGAHYSWSTWWVVRDERGILRFRFRLRVLGRSSYGYLGEKGDYFSCIDGEGLEMERLYSWRRQRIEYGREYDHGLSILQFLRTIRYFRMSACCEVADDGSSKRWSGWLVKTH